MYGKIKPEAYFKRICCDLEGAVEEIPKWTLDTQNQWNHLEAGSPELPSDHLFLRMNRGLER